MILRLSLLGVVFAWAASPLWAQPFTVDRPDFTESPNLVERGFLHAESGWMHPGSTPEIGTQLRYRVHRNWEVRTSVAVPLFWEVGAKWLWIRNDRFRLAWVNHVQPMQPRSWRSAVSGEHNRGAYTLGWNAGRQGSIGSAPEFAFLSHSHAVQCTPRWTVFAEGVHSNHPAEMRLHGWTPINAGVFWAVAPQCVLDGMVGWDPGVNQVHIHAGFSLRIPARRPASLVRHHSLLSRRLRSNTMVTR